MSEIDFCTQLLWDAASQTIASPGASHCWHRLANCYLQVDDESVKKALVEHLLTQTPTEGVAGFLRATWLTSMMRDNAHLAEAGRIVQDIMPIDPDRLATFLAFAWGNLLASPNDRRTFTQVVRNAFFPEILHKLGQHITVRLPVRKIERVRKVAIVSPYLSRYPHAPTAMVLNQARILVEQGLQVEIFSCRDLSVSGMEYFLGVKEATAVPVFDPGQWGSYCLSGVRVRQGVESFSVMARWAEILKHIAVFDPDLVLSVGFFSPLVAPLFKVRPVLGLNVHSVAPLDQVDVWLCASPEDAGSTDSEWGSSSVGWYHPYRIRRRPAASVLSRRKLGLSETALVLISVGDRLEGEIGGAWAVRMLDLLKNYPNVTWLLVGGIGKMPTALTQAPVSQVRTLSWHGDIPALLQCSDIYVNPPRMGGGFSVAEAMAEGLPVIAYADSDGGLKVGAAAVASDADYFSKLAALIASVDLRKQEGEEMRALFSAKLDLDQSGASLLAACDFTLERFMQRTKPASS
ncbi:glycosyltransferase family 4 protein [Candidatus Methylobacter oryzae]|uniref:Glycosyltransferase family 4 protein n=1 Tax=Candidatus Methylobacter oryzae TaxID=2497749 RepID=A0ABY3C5Q0_9GAMM|nr:glycosyltransferase family 4 protein [Candidatus Methylobacter oryzae]TRW90341.1 glycosyltransferase family 4 protein [Candidatus Methylobacter oryzae]